MSWKSLMSHLFDILTNILYSRWKRKKFNIEDIRLIVGNYNCPQNECTRVIPEMIKVLLGGKCGLTKNVICSNLPDVITTIQKYIGQTSLIEIWPSSGFADPHLTTPVWHGYIIFSVSPLQSFTAWPDGLTFYNEAETFRAIENTLNSKAHNNEITINQYWRVYSLFFVFQYIRKKLSHLS